MVSCAYLLFTQIRASALLNLRSGSGMHAISRPYTEFRAEIPDYMIYACLCLTQLHPHFIIC